MSELNYNALLEELNLSELGELCPDDKHRHKLIIYTLGLYASDMGFSPILKEFIKRYDIQVGHLLKNSPISLKMLSNQMEEKNMKGTIPTKKETPLDGTVSAEVVSALPEIITELTDEGTITLNWDADDEVLVLGEAQPSRSRKRKQAAEEEEDEDEKSPKKRGKKKASEGDESMSFGDFKKALKKELKETEDLAEYAEAASITWKKSNNEKINRMRIIAAVCEACGWADEDED